MEDADMEATVMEAIGMEATDMEGAGRVANGGFTTGVVPINQGTTRPPIETGLLALQLLDPRHL